MSEIAVLMTCHNRIEKTLLCLSALYKSKMHTIPLIMDIYLVDDGSNDNTGQIVKNKYPEINVIQGNGTLFWNRGMHLAWKTAVNKKKYDFFLWLNDDTLLFQNAIEVISNVSKIKKDESIVIGATCSKIDNTLTYSGFNINGNMIVPSSEIQSIITFNGNFVLIPSFVYDKVGIIDSLFHHAIGDIDYGLRASKLGINSYLCPNFLAFCEAHDTLPKWCLKEVPILTRLKSLYSPLGNSHPYYFFRFELRHFGIFVAIKHFLSIHLRVLYPNLWK